MTAEHSRGERDLVKVLFRLEPDVGEGAATETLWAERLGERRFRLRNVPFFVFGVSVEDVVLARGLEDGVLEFETVVVHGGHSTYRLKMNAAAPAERVQRGWLALEHLGCTYEQGPGPLRAVDVSPTAEIHKVYALLEHGEQEGLWEFEEGHCGHPL